jgi:solute carrier family 35 protein E3
MGANVVLMNLSLAHSSVIFSQIVRVLLAPLTAMMNLFIYSVRIPILAMMALIPACIGVGIVSHLEATAKQPAVPTEAKSTSMLGVIFAFSGVAVSALYTVWVSAYYRRLKLSTVQLLLNQMPLGALLLGVSSYFTDSYPDWSEINRHQWLMIALVSASRTLWETHTN